MPPYAVFILIACAAAGAFIGRRSGRKLGGALFGLLAGAAVTIGIVVMLHVIPPGASGDYRDPVQLAQAIQAKEGGAGASCAKMPAGTYMCTVVRAGGASGVYSVTVAADGRSYSVG